MCTDSRRVRRDTLQAGVSLIELVMFIMIVSIALAGVMSVFLTATQSSADPMKRKQVIAIAEALLEEVMLQPFTYCDPDDPNEPTATGAGTGPGQCSSAANVETFGSAVALSESRGSTTNPYDNVYDYAGGSDGAVGFSMTGIRSIDAPATVITGLSDYAATVTITQAAVGAVPASDSLRIDVRVTSPVASPKIDITLTGYRMRYAPN